MVRLQGQNPAAINAELFARAPGNVRLIMALLEPGKQTQSPHIRLNAVRLLAAIAAAGTPRLPEVAFSNNLPHVLLANHQSQMDM